MKNSKCLLLALLTFLINAISYSATPDTTSIIDNIYNYEFFKAKDRLSKLGGDDFLVHETLDLEIKWWMSLEKGNQNQFSDFLSTLNQMENTDKDQLSDIIFSTYRMRYYALNNRLLKIPFLFLKIQNQISKVDISQVRKSGDENWELFTLYKSFLALIQKSYFTNIFVRDHDGEELLIDNIESIAHNGAPSNRTLGTYFLMKYYLEIEKNRSKALDYLTVLHKQYPNNLIFAQLLTN
jgi:hypothetical protein